MKYRVKPCSTVGNAFMVVSASKFGSQRTLAIGLTEFEAKCFAKQLKEAHPIAALRRAGLSHLSR